MSDPFAFPPYGIVPEYLVTRASGKEEPPAHFLPTKPMDERRVAKTTFVRQFVDEVRDKYWPEWDPQTGWVGGAVPHMNAMTATDFELFRSIRPLLTIYPALPQGAQTLPRTHAACFATEDINDPKNPTGTFDEFQYYVPDVPATLVKSFGQIFLDGMRLKVGSISMELKARFQRPRAYQVAILHRVTDLSYVLAATATHPSLTAGHCLQGLMAGAFVDAVWKGQPTYVDGVSAALAQYSTDFGDRRVLAGVHYPSDSLITWLVAWRLIDYVFEAGQQARARAFVKQAIRLSRLWPVLNEKFPAKAEPANATVYAGLVSTVRALL